MLRGSRRILERSRSACKFHSLHPLRQQPVNLEPQTAFHAGSGSMPNVVLPSANVSLPGMTAAGAAHPGHWTAFLKSHPSNIWLHRVKGSKYGYYSRGSNFLTPKGILWTLIGTNIAVYCMWQSLDFRLMEKHFTVSSDSVWSGRLHTIITSAFSQKDAGHLLSNMIGLYFFGSEIGRIFGGSFLLKCYLAGAVGGALGHIFYCAYVFPWLKNIPHRYNTWYMPKALGASGAVTAITLLHIFLYPRHPVLFLMFLPMPAALVGAIIIGSDLWAASKGVRDVSVGSHLGGAVVAALACFSIKRRWL